MDEARRNRGEGDGDETDAAAQDGGTVSCIKSVCRSTGAIPVSLRVMSPTTYCCWLRTVTSVCMTRNRSPVTCVPGRRSHQGKDGSLSWRENDAVSCRGRKRRGIHNGSARDFLLIPRSASAAKRARWRVSSGTSLPADGYKFSGHSYDNTVALSSTTWRHVAFIEQAASRQMERARRSTG